MVTNPNYGLDLDVTLGGNNPSDIVVPSQKAIKTYVDNSQQSANSLGGLSDVSLSSPANGEVLQYNGTNWTNATKTLVTLRNWS